MSFAEELSYMKTFWLVYFIIILIVLYFMYTSGLQAINSGMLIFPTTTIVSTSLQRFHKINFALFPNHWSKNKHVVKVKHSDIMNFLYLSLLKNTEFNSWLFIQMSASCIFCVYHSNFSINRFTNTSNYVFERKFGIIGSSL